MSWGARFDDPIALANGRKLLTLQDAATHITDRLTYHYTNEENGLVLRRYRTNACRSTRSNNKMIFPHRRRRTVGYTTVRRLTHDLCSNFTRTQREIQIRVTKYLMTIGSR